MTNPEWARAFFYFNYKVKNPFWQSQGDLPKNKD